MTSRTLPFVTSQIAGFHEGMLPVCVSKRGIGEVHWEVSINKKKNTMGPLRRAPVSLLASAAAGTLAFVPVMSVCSNVNRGLGGHEASQAVFPPTWRESGRGRARVKGGGGGC